MSRPNHPQLGAIPVKDNTSSRLAWSLAVAAIIGTIAALAFGLRSAYISGDSGAILTHLSLTPFITISFAVIGAMVASRQPQNPIGWIFLSVGILYALTGFTGVYSSFAPLFSESGALPGVKLAGWLNSWLWIPTVFLPTIFVFLLFPDGRLLSPRWRIVLWSAVLGPAMIILAVALHPGPVETWDLQTNPYGIPAAADILDLVIQLAQVLILIGFVGSIASFIVRFRRSQGGNVPYAFERQQMKWLLYALVLMLLGFIVGTAFWFVSPASSLASELSITITNLAILGIAVAASIAILRYRLYDIDLVINRTLVYGTLTVSIIIIYVLIVGGLGLLFQTQGNLLVALLATGLVAVLFQPLRDRTQRGVDRVFYGQRDDPLKALSRLGRRLEAAIEPEVVLPTLVETIAETLKLTYVAIGLRTGDEFKIAAQTGDEVAGAITLPLIYQGQTVGQLIAGPRAAGEPFSQTDIRLLENIAHQAGPAVHAIQLTVALQHSRHQLVTAREEERRRLRRDLHDGLGATLAALHLEAGVLRRWIRNDPDKAEALVDEIKTDIRSTIEDIRRLVYDLRPPTLDQLGLAAAVRAQAVQCSRSDDRPSDEPVDPVLQVRVEAPEELPPLPAAVEVAAYRIAQEALTNVVHHAHARQCLVRLEMTDELKMEVVDDGVGLANGRRENGGVGLLSMRERAMELGGTCVIEPASGGGTRVLVSLPLKDT